jgi:uncharacterized metal-binding protein
MVGDEIELMINEATCGCASRGVVIYACSGGANVGQLSNEAAKMLSLQKFGKMSCAVGLGAHASGIVESGKAAGATVALDGFKAHCVRKAMEHVGIEPMVHMVITDLGFKKSYEDLDTRREDVELVVKAVKEALG